MYLSTDSEPDERRQIKMEVAMKTKKILWIAKEKTGLTYGELVDACVDEDLIEDLQA